MDASARTPARSGPGDDPAAPGRHRMTRLIHVTAVMLAAAASMAGFSQVIGPVLPYLSRWAVITAAAGFVGVSLTMGHFAGQMLRDRLEGPQVVPAGRIALIALA